MRLANCEPREIILLVDTVMVGDVMNEMEVFFSTIKKLSEKLEKITNNLPKVHVFTSVNLHFI
jgi:hypothetical protein